MDKKSKIILIISIISFALAITAVTYAYFSAKITGIDSASTLSLNAGTMGIHYAEGNENVSISDMYPRSEPWITKTFTLTGNNNTDQTMEYEVGLDIITNTFKGGQLSFSLEVGNSNVGTSMSPVNYKSITKPNGTMLIGHGAFPGPVTNGIQEYTLKIYFLDNGKDQSVNQSAVFNANITVQDRGSIAVDNSCTTYRTETITTIESYDLNYDNCMAYLEEYPLLHATEEQEQQYCNGEEITVTWTVLGRTRTITYSIEKSLQSDSTQLIDAGVVTNVVINTEEVTTDLGSPYTEGGYTYTYLEEENGWAVIQASSYKNNARSFSFTPCVVINDQPVIAMNNLFGGSLSTSIDLGDIDTSNVTNMSGMFYDIRATQIIGLENFDTSNVTDMSGMFQRSAATSLDLSSFNTANVTDMSKMFYQNSATTLDLSSFDTSSVTNMSSMFYGSAATSLDLTSFDTSNVTNMSSMFYGSAATSLDLSSFNTSNVTDMSKMFINNNATSLNLSSFNTVNVTNMSSMFQGSAATSLDLSSFNTASVTDMTRMFQDSAATQIIGLESFNTAKVTDMSWMFQGSDATTLNLSSFDTASVTTMQSMFQDSAATSLDLSSFNTVNVTSMTSMFQDSAATSLDLSSFNTANVEWMGEMFQNSSATVLDLSTFDTSNVKAMSYMFKDSVATTGYARTQPDANRFNNVTGSLSNGNTPYTNIPSTLTFIVKTN